MGTKKNELVIRADYKELTFEVIAYVIMTLVLVVLNLYLLFSIYESTISPKNGTDGIILSTANIFFAVMFSIVIIIFVRFIKKCLLLRKELPVLYFFTETGFTFHGTNEFYEWTNFKKISKAKHGIYLHLKNKKRKAVALRFNHISNEAYRSIILHIKEHAPKNLPIKVRVPES